MDALYINIFGGFGLLNNCHMMFVELFVYNNDHVNDSISIHEVIHTGLSITNEGGINTPYCTVVASI